MAKKIILSESQVKHILMEKLASEMTASEVDKKIKDAIKSNDKEMEKKMKKLISKTISILFRTLWQRSGFYAGEIEKI